MSCVTFIKYAPHESLTKFIEFYYVLKTGPGLIGRTVPIFAHAGSHVLVNWSNLPLNFSDNSLLIPGKVYMGGASTSALFVDAFPDSTFVGVRFKPGGLSVFYSMHMAEISNQMIEFQDHHFCGIVGTDEGFTQRLDKFYRAKFTSATNAASAIEAVNYYKGNISVDTLAYKCNVSQRSLERMFEANVGISPKKFINIVRFEQAVNSLQKENPTSRLQDIAFEYGYYDLAHFANDFKKHSGFSPSKIWPSTTRQ
jgi:AraC-like DNA-binding protein